MLTRCCVGLAALMATWTLAAEPYHPSIDPPIKREWPPSPTRDYLRNLKRSRTNVRTYRTPRPRRCAVMKARPSMPNSGSSRAMDPIPKTVGMP